LVGRYYKRLRSDLLIGAFKEDAVMIKAAEDALTAFLDSPLKFGMIFTGARAEAWILKPIWRLKSYWLVMFADHINSIIADHIAHTLVGETDALSRLSDALNLCVLMTDKSDDFPILLKMHFRALILYTLNWHNHNDLKEVFERTRRVLLLQRFVVRRLEEARVYHRSSLDAIYKVLDDYKEYTVYELPGRRGTLVDQFKYRYGIICFDRIFDGKTGLEFKIEQERTRQDDDDDDDDDLFDHLHPELGRRTLAEFLYLSQSVWNDYIKWPAW
jgi:hypothetical protein